MFRLDENAIRYIPLNTEHFIIDILSTLDTLNSIGLGKNVSIELLVVQGKQIALLLSKFNFSINRSFLQAFT